MEPILSAKDVSFAYDNFEENESKRMKEEGGLTK